MAQHLQIIGCGNIGKRVAGLYLDQDIRIIATVSSHESQCQCKALGLTSNLLDLDQPFHMPEMSNHSRLLYTIPPPRSGTTDSRLTAFLAQLDASRIDQFVLISTTGVYGDCAGEWVNEGAAINPGVDRARRRADAEQQLQSWAKLNQTKHIILRVPGIYSLDRLPLKRLEAGTPIVKNEQSPWTNRIHADDLARICLAALNSDIKNEIINIADDAPGTMTEYFNAIADYAGLSRPPQISLEEAQKSLSAGMLSYLAESRRIDNQKMKELLKINLQYPSLAQALKKSTSA